MHRRTSRPLRRGQGHHVLLEREWVTVNDPDDDHRRVTFDVSFLLSAYTCIYGSGCPSIHPDQQDPTLGCCEHGAYLTDDDDAAQLTRMAREGLDAATMQHHAAAMADGVIVTDTEHDPMTRVVDGGCIFLNRAGFSGSTGCALHHLAVATGRHPADTKPTVCWQVPLHRTIEESVANDGEVLEHHTIAAFERGHWGEGGSDFGWWCLDDEQAMVGRQPLYRSMEVELRRMVGSRVYEELASYLDRRRRQRGRVRFQPRR